MTIHYAQKSDLIARCGVEVARKVNTTTVRRLAASTIKEKNVNCKRCQKL